MKFLPWQHRDLPAPALLAWARDYDQLAQRLKSIGRKRLAAEANAWAEAYRSAASEVESKEAA